METIKTLKERYRKCLCWCQRMGVFENEALELHQIEKELKRKGESLKRKQKNK